MSMTTSGAEEANFLRILRKQIEQAMQQAAEPVIQEAVKQAEHKMRAALGTAVLSLLERSYSVHRHGNELHIVVTIEKK